MGNLSRDASEQLRKRIQQAECEIVRAICDDSAWLSSSEQANLRWALSLSRVSKVRSLEHSPHAVVNLGQASDRYRAELFALLSSALAPKSPLDKGKIKSLLPQIEARAMALRRELLTLFATLTPKALDDAVRRRPLALALGGGGGTSFVFGGAFLALEEAGITPSAMAGSSMGAILGAYRARDLRFSTGQVQTLVEQTPFKMIIQPFSGSSRFGLPATFRLYLRDVVGHEFERNGHFLRLKDLAIPFRVCVAGLTSAQPPKDEELSYYTHLLDETKQDPHKLANAKKSIVTAILDFAQQPLKAIYLGRDPLTKEFDVLDAIGFSAAIPGIFHYDILRNDTRMVALVTNLLAREGVFRLMDGGLVDNLPAKEAGAIVDDGECEGYDPLVIALDAFSPMLNRHIMFYPLMRFAAENSREGREAAHLTVSFKNVLSPVTLLPTKETLRFAFAQGYQEFLPHIHFIRKMIGPIPDPSWIS